MKKIKTLLLSLFLVSVSYMAEAQSIRVMYPSSDNISDETTSVLYNRSFDLKTVSGGIRASILSGKTFDCHSTSGGVHVPQNGGEGTFRARTTSGGIRVEVVSPEK